MLPEQFVEFWTIKNSNGIEKPNGPEKRMSVEYGRLKQELQDMRKELLSYIKPQKSKSGGLIAVFDDEAVNLMSRYESVEAAYENLKSDIETVTRIANGPSLDLLRNERHRLRKFLEDADHAIESAKRAAIKSGKDDKVIEAQTKRDKLGDTYSARLSEIEALLKKANEIINKY